ncbi:MAG: hypothetical protein ABJF07_09715 [Nisaea sp.]|uniref:hypothetical protein n=1 Tax=Nisaea sp. TaxID=2024842 RepID=UPI003265001B
MKLIKAGLDETVISFTTDDIAAIQNLFVVLSGTDNPNWDETDEGTGAPALTSELFYETWKDFNEVTHQAAIATGALDE